MPIAYAITGAVARNRIQPLLPDDWVEQQSNDDATALDFLWENTPRLATKDERNHVRCYSHLPNGSHLLDSKWVLGRLMMLHPANGTPMTNNNTTNNYTTIDWSILETNFFVGPQGYHDFLERVRTSATTTTNDDDATSYAFRDLLHDNPNTTPLPPPPNPHWWVVKDAWANGAGGVWVVDPQNQSLQSLPLYESHAYIAQRYAWPPVLYGGRKCHVRVYALLTASNAAYVHRTCFLHVANEPFTILNGADDVHITNCCANAHNADKFAGEICADLDATSSNDSDVVGLAAYAPSIRAAVAALAQRSLPFLRGGQANGGFEYMGLDFILSQDTNDTPVAYLLEVNAPPSQDTATGLPHAEAVHDTVLRDLLHLWVIPRVVPGTPAQVGGWECVYREEERTTTTTEEDEDMILPSKAAILNKIRWTLFERKQQNLAAAAAAANETTLCKDLTTPSQHPVDADAFANFARSLFPYYNSSSSAEMMQPCEATGPPPIFLENAGGTQVPRSVLTAMTEALSARHRCKIGAASVQAAKGVLATWLGVSKESHDLFFGANASSLLWSLSHQYHLSPADEIVVAVHNHWANVQPWIELCRRSGATLRWWDPSDALLVIQDTTRIVAVPHASNVTGHVLDLAELRATLGETVDLIVDGVAAVPHIPAGAVHADWYVVSLHKVFGPHLGVLCGRRQECDTPTSPIQTGTVNYEACAGVVGLGRYWNDLAQYGAEKDSDAVLTPTAVQAAYHRIRTHESQLLSCLLNGLQRGNLQFIGPSNTNDRLPIVSFRHATLASQQIVDHCFAHSVVCRSGTFLAAPEFLRTRGDAPFVRLSLVHYNTMEDVHRTLDVLEKIPGWMET